MQRVLQILFGAGFAVASCWAAGALLLRRLKLDFDPLESALFAFLSGAACLSVLVFLFCLAHWAYPAVFLAAGAGTISAALWKRPHSGKRLPPIPRSCLVLFFLCATPFFFVYFINALAPEVSPDGSGYHLGNVMRLISAHGFVWDYRSMYSCFPQGIEMLFLVAVSLGGRSSAALVHLSFFVALPLLLICYGRRFGLVRASIFAAILVFASPVYGLIASSAYNDTALVTLSFAVFYLVQVFNDINAPNTLIPLGLLSGLCVAVKYPGAVVPVFTVTALLLSRRRLAWTPLLGATALPILPWVLRNWIWIGNPVAPLLNRWFPSPYFSTSWEKAYLSDVGTFPAFHHWWELPLDVSLYGAKIPGFLGPIFLLAPVTLLALRSRHGRRLLAAAVLFSVPFAFNAATRFLLPGIPLLALAFGIVIENSPGIIPLLAISQAILCWPGVTPLYSADWSWRIREIPVRAALRLEPEADFVRRRLPDTALAPAVHAAVPPGGRVFSYSTRPEAYFDRTILVGYESAEGNAIQSLLNRNATGELKRRNVGFLLLNAADPVPPAVTLLAESHGTAFYRID